MAETLYIVTCISNPLRWRTRIDLARVAIADWLKEPNVHVTLVECTYGRRPYQLADLASERVMHVPVRANTLAWNKENLLNIGISRLPPGARKIATFDADITFRRSDWATNALATLDLYPVAQPWDACYDLGPHDEHMQTHRSFCSVYHSGKPVVPNSDKFWDFNGGPYTYPHPGYAWLWLRETLDWIGGLFELGGMGAADHHQALSLVGAADKSLPGGTSNSYREAVIAWQNRALVAVNKKLGFTHGTIEHGFHGSKIKRNYISRWDMFLKHGFDPVHDLKRNTSGVLEFSGRNPELEREWANYLAARSEDANTID